MVELKLPRVLTTNEVEDLIRLLHGLRAVESNVVIDCSDLRYIEPVGLVLLASALHGVPEPYSVEFRWLSKTLTDYLHRMDFFEKVPVIGVDIDATRQRHDQTGSMCELKCLQFEHEAEAAVSTFAQAITGKAFERTGDGVDFDQYYIPISYALSELVMNALTHAKREGRGDAKVWIAAQYYPQTHTVKASVTDDGCGFLGTLRNHSELRGEKTHVAAIQAALVAGVSCNRNYARIGLSENQGVGLTVTKRIVTHASGNMLIASGDAIHHVSAGRPGFKRSGDTRVMAGYWQGVAVAFELPRDQLPRVDVSALMPEEAPTPQDGADDIKIDFV